MNYKCSMMEKATEIRNNLSSNESNEDPRPLDNTALKRQELQIAERSLAAHEKDRSDRQSNELRERAVKRTVAVTKAKKKVDAIFEDTEKLYDKLAALGDPKTVTDIVQRKLLI